MGKWAEGFPSPLSIMLDMDKFKQAPMRAPRPAQLLIHALRPQAPTANSHTRQLIFLAPSRRSTFGATIRDISTITHHHPYLSRELNLPQCCKRLRRLAQCRGESASVVLAGRWLAVLCIYSASICVAPASSMVRHNFFFSIHDGILLDEGTVPICCDIN